MNPESVGYPARYLCGANSLPVWVVGKQRESSSGFVCQNYNCPDSQPFFVDASMLSPWVELEKINKAPTLRGIVHHLRSRGHRWAQFNCDGVNIGAQVLHLADELELLLR